METKNAEMIVKVEIKNVYGNRMIYPVNEAASLFAAIAKKKTLDTSDIKNIKALGFKIEVVSDIPNL